MSEKTVVLENLSELYWAEFPGPTNVVIKNDENWCRRLGTIIKDNILSLKIEKPGVFSTSDDGKLLYAKDPETRNLWIIDYFGKDDKEIVIEDGVYGIYRGAFQGAKSIKSVMFPKSVQVIGERSFEDCKSLEKIKFSEGLKRISDYAFQHTGVKKVDIPASVSTIGGKSFGDCFRSFGQESPAIQLPG